MASMMRPAKLLSLLVFVSFFCQFYALQNVPLVYWSSEGRSSESQTNILAGHTLSGKEAYQILNKDSITYRERKLLVVFIQDQLSIDDFTKYSNSYKYMKHTFEKVHPVSLPSVSIEQKPTVLDLLQDDFKGKIQEIYSSDIGDWKYSSDALNERMLIFHLNPVSESVSDGRAKILKSNDATIHKILSQIQEKTNQYSVILTGEKPNEAISRLHAAELFDDISSSSQRHLLATSNAEKLKVNITGFIMMSAAKVVAQEGQTSMTGADFESKEIANSTLKVTSAGANSSFSFEIAFKPVAGDGWGCSSVTLNIEGKSATFPCGSSSLEETITAPDNMAYGCQSTMIGNATLNITLEGVKVQFGNKDGKWGEVYECATLFTVPILSGLFITLLLAVSVLLGLSSMAAIQTPDRFDDPKGPMISVPQTE